MPSSADPLRGPDLEERVAALEAELRRGLRRLGPIVAAGLLLALLAATWSGLWAQAPQGQLALVTLLGAAPALVRIAPVRRAALWAALTALLAAVCALGVAVGASPLRIVTGDGDTWSALGDIIPEGLGNASSTPLPLLPDRPQALSALLLLILCGGAALIAWQAIVARRPLAAIVATGVGLAYRWTLVPPDRPVLTGTVTLVVALVVFRLVGAATGPRDARPRARGPPRKRHRGGRHPSQPRWGSVVELLVELARMGLRWKRGGHRDQLPPELWAAHVSRQPGR